MRHFIPPPSFDPTVLIDVAELQKELEDHQDNTMIEEDIEDDQDAMKVE